MDGKMIKKTQDSLGKIVKKPPLTDKLLSKPPFRFLHDIITSVIKSTGFMKGLYVEDEMKSDNVKDKDSKCVFLQKAVDMVSLVLGRTLSVKPSKVVAGHEPEKTNEFLQNLAEAVNKKVNNDDYVQRVLKGDKDAGSSSKKEKSSKDRDKSSDRRKRDKEKDRDTEKEEKDKERERRHKSRDREDRKERDKDKEHREKSRDRDHKKDKKDKERDDDKHRDKEKDRRKRKEKEEGEDGEREKSRDREKERDRRRKEREEEKAQEPVVNGERDDGGAAQQRIPRPSSAKGSRRRHGHDEEQHKAPKKEKEASSTMNGTLGEEDLPPQVAAARKIARPSSARPAPPRVKKNDGLQEDAPMLGQSNVPNIITDKGDSSEEEDDGFMAKEEDLPAPDLTEPTRTAAQIDPEDADHGGLVKKMLKTKEELEGGSQTQQGQRKTEIERSSQVSDATRRKEREMVQKEIDKLRASIQTLTRSVNPLGKIMDFVQEDLDSMQKELEMWKKENKENAVKLQREQSITESSIEPLKAHQNEIDASITDQLDLIAAVKSNIIKNDDRIEKMMGSVTKS